MVIDEAKAYELAAVAVADMPTKDTGPLVIVAEDTCRLAEGWVFFYVTERYRQTGDFQFTLLGNAPIFVALNGGVHSLGPTAYPWEENLKRLLESKA